ncbi:MAG: molybdopterin adenylyltransferase [Planctomycetota bacterium]
MTAPIRGSARARGSALSRAGAPGYGKAMRPSIGIVTVSDRASAGLYEDLSGPAIEDALRAYLATECSFERRIVPDDRHAVAVCIRELASRCCLVCTTGGTGPAPRDVTPEAIRDVCEKELPGFGEAMRAASLRTVPTAILSRQTAAICGRALVVTLPGKPGSIRVCLDAVFPAIPYCIDLIGGPRLEGNEDVVKVFRPEASDRKPALPEED